MNRPVYLIIDKGDGSKPVWRNYGTAYQCKDGSFNIRLDLFPGFVFNCRLPSSVLEGHQSTFGTLDKKIPEEVV